MVRSKSLNLMFLQSNTKIIMEIEINTVHLSATLSTESLKVIEILISYIVLD